jgi:hypothetical protein
MLDESIDRHRVVQEASDMQRRRTGHWSVHGGFVRPSRYRVLDNGLNLEEGKPRWTMRELEAPETASGVLHGPELHDGPERNQVCVEA